jgi:hypothetical protein
MKRALVAAVVAAVIVVVAVVVTNNNATSPGAAPLVSHRITPTPATMGQLRATFVKYKLHYKEMVSTDRITWGQVIEPHGAKLPLIAYDAVDRRYWAIASFNLILPASYKANVSFQDGGNMGIFNKIGAGPWVMTGSPGFPLCAKDVPSVVAHLWGLKNYPACG